MQDMTLSGLLKGTREAVTDAAVKAAHDTVNAVEESRRAGGYWSPEAIKDDLERRIREACKTA